MIRPPTDPAGLTLVTTPAYSAPKERPVSRRPDIQQIGRAAALDLARRGMDLPTLALLPAPPGHAGPVAHLLRRSPRWIVRVWSSPEAAAAHPHTPERWAEVLLGEGRVVEGSPDRRKAAAKRGAARPPAADLSPYAAAVRAWCNAPGAVLLTGTQAPPAGHAGAAIHLRRGEGAVHARVWTHAARWRAGQREDRRFRFAGGPDTIEEVSPDPGKRYRRPRGGPEGRPSKGVERLRLRITPTLLPAVEAVQAAVGAPREDVIGVLLDVAGWDLHKAIAARGPAAVERLPDPSATTAIADCARVNAALSEPARERLDALARATGRSLNVLGRTLLAAGLAIWEKGRVSGESEEAIAARWQAAADLFRA